MSPPPGAGQERHRPKGQEPLEQLAQARPALAARARALQARVDALAPAGRRLDADRFAAALAELARLGLLRSPNDSDLAGAAGSALVNETLDALSGRADAELRAWAAVLTAADALGADYRPDVAVIAAATDALRARPDLARVRASVAALAGAAGGADLLRRMKTALRSRPEAALDFLELVCDGRSPAPPPVAPPGVGFPAPQPFWRPEDTPAPSRGGSPLFERLRHLGDRLLDDGVGLGRAVQEYAQRRFERRRDDRAPDVGEREDRGRAAERPARRPEQQHAPGALVSSGFAAVGEESGWPKHRSLQAETTYRFWIEIGPERPEDATEQDHHRLVALPSGTDLDVAVFGFDDELQPIAGEDRGRMRLEGATAVVIDATGQRAGRRLWLAVRTSASGRRTQRLRCNVYRGNVLLQSRLISAEVRPHAARTPHPAFRSEVDFSIARDLSARAVAGLRPVSLSVLINDNGAGTHGFRFFGGAGFKQDLVLGGDDLRQQLEQTRAMLREVSWGSREEPTAEEFGRLQDRYATPDRERLADDLIALARTGFRVWDGLVDGLSGGDVAALRALMRPPGRLQIANKQSANLLVPAACLYDAKLRPSAVDVRLCPAYLSATGPLRETPCFQGRCPTWDDELIVCPSGFWGFRHEIGYSASLPFSRGAGSDDADTIALAAGPGHGISFVVGASTDPFLRRRDDHLARVRQLAGSWSRADSATALLGLFGASKPSVVYLYGHGGGDDTSPFFVVGDEADGPIRRADLRDAVDWRDARPLVFLNGCRSSPLRPGAAFSYASGFLQTAHAAGVIGTEISIFESLATAFAEECLRRMVADREPLGSAVRATRLRLLEQGTPLGLAYLAFGPLDVQIAA